MTAPLGPGYTDTFSNRSVFISLRFQIDPLWILSSAEAFGKEKLGESGWKE